MVLELTESGESLKEWSEKESKNEYGEPKNIKEAQSTIDDWKETAKKKRGSKSEKQLRQIENIINDIDFKSDVKQRNDVYIEDITENIHSAQNLKELGSITIDEDYEPKTRGILARRKNARDFQLSRLEELKEFTPEEREKATIGSLIVGKTLTRSEAGIFKETGELP